MRLLVVALVLSTAVAAPAFAGTVITSEISAPNVAGNSVVYYIEPDRVRMEYPGHIVIFRADQDTEYMLAPAEKKFRRMTPETMKQSAAPSASDGPCGVLVSVHASPSDWKPAFRSAR